MRRLSRFQKAADRVNLVLFMRLVYNYVILFSYYAGNEDIYETVRDKYNYARTG